MKKTILRVVALALLAVMTCMVFVSCGGPASDPDKADKALDKEGYKVLHATNKLEAVALGGWYDGCEEVILATKDKDLIYVWYFDEKDSANNAWEKIEEFAKKINDDAKEEKADIVIKKSGKIIYAGTEQAIKDAR